MIQRLSLALKGPCNVRPGAAVLVALSGGGDSVALLHLLRELAVDWPLRLSAAHLDHALRPESGADAAWVAELCRQWRIPLVQERIEVRALAAASRSNLEEVAREQRHAFLLRAADQLGCELVALGHHAGDQAETLLQRLLRGTGTAGLCGMAWRRGRLIRPLLEVSPEALDRYRRDQLLVWRDDASNRDLSLTRNRLRHQLIPLLQDYNPEVLAALGRLAGQLQVDEDYWQVRADAELDRLAEPVGQALALPVAALLELHPALRLRVLRRALQRSRGDLRGIEAVHLAALEGLLTGRRPQAEIHLPGAWAGRRYDRLLLGSAAPQFEAGADLRIAAPGIYRLPGGGRLEVALAPGDGMTTACRVQFDPQQVDFPLRVRPVRPGDRFRPSGMSGHKKVKDYWIDARMPREARRQLLVLEGREILWLLGERRCEGWWPKSGEEPALQLVFTPGDGAN